MNATRSLFVNARVGGYHAAVVLLVILALMLSTACSAGDAERYDYFRITVAGQETLGVSIKDAMVRGVIVYFHGAGTDEFVIAADESHQNLVNSLVHAGFAIVSSEAHGDSWGSRASQEAYLALAGVATNHYHTENLYFLAEDMGSLAAVKLMALAPTARIRGLAAINPVLDLARVAPEDQAAVEASYRDRPLDPENPMTLPPSVFADRKMMFFVDSSDHRAPADVNARAFSARFAPPAEVTIVDCVGAADCLQGDELVKWFTKLEKRN